MASSLSPHSASNAADGSIPAHSGPVAATAAATRSPKLSAITSSFVEQWTAAPGAPPWCVALGRGSWASWSTATSAPPAAPPPTRLRTRWRISATLVEWASHHLANWRSTFQGARGSRNVAVPTWTASAPASNSSTASRPEKTPPTPTMGSSGNAARHSHTARTATGCTAAPDSPPPPAPRKGRPDSVSRARPSSVFTSVSPSAPPSTAPVAISTRSGTFGLSLAQRGSPHAVASSTRAVASAEWANMRERSSTLGQLTLISSAPMHEPAPEEAATATRARRPRVVRHRTTPDAHDDARARGVQRREIIGDPGRQPGALQAHAVEHAGPDLVHPRCRVARPRLDAERLDDDRAEVAQRLRTRPAPCRGPTSRTPS